MAQGSGDALTGPQRELQALEAGQDLPQRAPAPSGGGGEDLSPYNPMDTYAFQLSMVFLALGFVLIALQLRALRGVNRVTADDIARTSAVTLVVVSSVALLVSGYSSAQVAPAFGLFGTIIGYMLGRERPRREDDGPANPSA